MTLVGGVVASEGISPVIPQSSHVLSTSSEKITIIPSRGVSSHADVTTRRTSLREAICGESATVRRCTASWNEDVYTIDSPKCSTS